MNHQQMDRMFEEALHHLRNKSWMELEQIIESNPLLASYIDPNGMLLLHFVCKEPAVSELMLQLLIHHYPDGLSHRNGDGMLPVHLAVQAQLATPLIQLMVREYPKSLQSRLPSNDGSTVALSELMERNKSIKSAGLTSFRTRSQTFPTSTWPLVFKRGPSTKSFIHASSTFDGAIPSIPKENALKWKIEVHTPASEPQLSCGNLTSSFRSFTSSSESSVSSPLGSAEAHNVIETPRAPLSHGYARFREIVYPPLWSYAKMCSICLIQFGTFCKRYHCRNCGNAICRKDRSKQKFDLPFHGLCGKQLVCRFCAEDQLTKSASGLGLGMSQRKAKAKAQAKETANEKENKDAAQPLKDLFTNEPKPRSTEMIRAILLNDVGLLATGLMGTPPRPSPSTLLAPTSSFFDPTPVPLRTREGKKDPQSTSSSWQQQQKGVVAAPFAAIIDEKMIHGKLRQEGMCRQVDSSSREGWMDKERIATTGDDDDDDEVFGRSNTYSMVMNYVRDGRDTLDSGSSVSDMDEGSVYHLNPEVDEEFSRFDESTSTFDTSVRL